MNKLYPPNIEGVIPAFYGTTLVVPFSMNKMVPLSEVNGLILKIKTVQSNTFILTDEIAWTAETIKNIGHYYEAQFDLTEQAINEKLNIGQHYKIQIAYRNLEGLTGYYSTVGIVKYTTMPSVTIDLLNSGNIENAHLHSYIGRYLQNGDSTEKVYSYSFNLYNDKYELIKTSGELIHNIQNNNSFVESTDTYVIEEDLQSGIPHYIQYNVVTNNLLYASSPLYKIIQYDLINPQIEAELQLSLDYDNGAIEIQPCGKLDINNQEIKGNGNFKIIRANEKDNFITWNTIIDFRLNNQKPSDFIWKDYMIEQGVEYKYALQQYNENGVVSNKSINNKIKADFEHIFISDGKRQLTIKYNPKVSSFKETIIETKTNTLGSKYPFFTRTSKIGYKEFPISGLISFQMDDNFTFSDFGKEERLFANIDLNRVNIYNERNFKMEVLDWLNNGELKVVRSPVEGNYIVRLNNCSLSPVDQVGRMLHTFQATATEMADYNYNNLVKNNFIHLDKYTKDIVQYRSIELQSQDIGINLLEGPASSILIDGAAAGTIFKADGNEIIIPKNNMRFELSLQQGAVINELILINSTSIGIINYTFTQNYYSNFDLINSVEVINEWQQFIGENNIIEQIQNIATELDHFFYIQCFVHDNSKDTTIKFDDKIIDIKLLSEYVINEPMKFNKFVIGSGITALVGYQKKVINYNNFQQELDEKYSQLYNLIYQINAEEDVISEAYNDYKVSYNFYVNNLNNYLQDKEEE